MAGRPAVPDSDEKSKSRLEQPFSLKKVKKVKKRIYGRHPVFWYRKVSSALEIRNYRTLCLTPCLPASPQGEGIILHITS